MFCKTKQLKFLAYLDFVRYVQQHGVLRHCVLWLCLEAYFRLHLSVLGLLHISEVSSQFGVCQSRQRNARNSISHLCWRQHLAHKGNQPFLESQKQLPSWVRSDQRRQWSWPPLHRLQWHLWQLVCLCFECFQSRFCVIDCQWYWWIQLHRCHFPDVCST